MGDCWEKIQKLGAGSFGTVFKATDDFSRFIAVKSADCSDSEAVSSLRREARILSRLDGIPNVVRCFGEDVSVENGRRIYNVLLDYAPGGTLHDLIQKTYSRGKTLPEPHVALYASMLLRALAGIHAKGIVHCDLKPANILIFPASSGEELINNLKLADFGSARRVLEKEDFKVMESEGTETYSRTTLPYASPESVSSGEHGTATDIWSFGCIVMEMVTGKRVFDYRDNEDLVNQILQGVIYIPGKDRISNLDGVEFLMGCFERHPKGRMSAVQLLHHPFIVNNLKIMFQAHGIDLNKMEDPNCSDINPFGRSEWVTKKHLFSKGQQQQQQHHDLIQEGQQHHQHQFQPSVRVPVQNSHPCIPLSGRAAAKNCLRV